jgi:hypothetical protein
MAMRVIMAADMTSGAFHDTGIEIIDNYYFWLGVFFFFGAPLTFT